MYVNASATYPSLKSTCHANFSTSSFKKIENRKWGSVWTYTILWTKISDSRRRTNSRTCPIQTDSLHESLHGSRPPAVNSALAEPPIRTCPWRFMSYPTDMPIYLRWLRALEEEKLTIRMIENDSKPSRCCQTNRNYSMSHFCRAFYVGLMSSLYQRLGTKFSSSGTSSHFSEQPI